MSEQTPSNEAASNSSANNWPANIPWEPGNLCLLVAANPPTASPLLPPGNPNCSECTNTTARAQVHFREMKEAQRQNERFENYVKREADKHKNYQLKAERRIAQLTEMIKEQLGPDKFVPIEQHHQQLVEARVQVQQSDSQLIEQLHIKHQSTQSELDKETESRKLYMQKADQLTKEVADLKDENDNMNLELHNARGVLDEAADQKNKIKDLETELKSKNEEIVWLRKRLQDNADEARRTNTPTKGPQNARQVASSSSTTPHSRNNVADANVRNGSSGFAMPPPQQTPTKRTIRTSDPSPSTLNTPSAPRQQPERQRSHTVDGNGTLGKNNTSRNEPSSSRTNSDFGMKNTENLSAMLTQARDSAGNKNILGSTATNLTTNNLNRSLAFGHFAPMSPYPSMDDLHQLRFTAASGINPSMTGQNMNARAASSIDQTNSMAPPLRHRRSTTLGGLQTTHNSIGLCFLHGLDSTLLSLPTAQPAGDGGAPRPPRTSSRTDSSAFVPHTPQIGQQASASANPQAQQHAQFHRARQTIANMSEQQKLAFKGFIHHIINSQIRERRAVGNETEADAVMLGPDSKANTEARTKYFKELMVIHGDVLLQRFRLHSEQLQKQQSQDGSSGPQMEVPSTPLGAVNGTASTMPANLQNQMPSAALQTVRLDSRVGACISALTNDQNDVHSAMQDNFQNTNSWATQIGRQNGAFQAAQTSTQNVTRSAEKKEPQDDAPPSSRRSPRLRAGQQSTVFGALPHAAQVPNPMRQPQANMWQDGNIASDGTNPMNQTRNTNGSLVQGHPPKQAPAAPWNSPVNTLDLLGGSMPSLQRHSQGSSSQQWDGQAPAMNMGNGFGQQRNNLSQNSGNAVSQARNKYGFSSNHNGISQNNNTGYTQDSPVDRIPARRQRSNPHSPVRTASPTRVRASVSEDPKGIDDGGFQGIVCYNCYRQWWNTWCDENPEGCTNCQMRGVTCHRPTCNNPGGCQNYRCKKAHSGHQFSGVSSSKLKRGSNKRDDHEEPPAKRLAMEKLAREGGQRKSG